MVNLPTFLPPIHTFLPRLLDEGHMFPHMISPHVVLSILAELDQIKEPSSAQIKKILKKLYPQYHILILTILFSLRPKLGPSLEGIFSEEYWQKQIRITFNNDLFFSKEFSYLDIFTSLTLHELYTHLSELEFNHISATIPEHQHEKEAILAHAAGLGYFNSIATYCNLTILSFNQYLVDNNDGRYTLNTHGQEVLAFMNNLLQYSTEHYKQLGYRLGCLCKLKLLNTIVSYRNYDKYLGNLKREIKKSAIMDYYLARVFEQHMQDYIPISKKMYPHGSSQFFQPPNLKKEMEIELQKLLIIEDFFKKVYKQKNGYINVLQLENLQHLIQPYLDNIDWNKLKSEALSYIEAQGISAQNIGLI